MQRIYDLPDFIKFSDLLPDLLVQELLVICEAFVKELIF